MNRARYFVFGRFRLDCVEGRLWRGTTAVRLTRKAHGMLAHLVAHAGQLVTKDELLTAVWPRSVVVEGVLTTVVRELRRALEDQTRTPVFIQTVHRQGYRFIAPVTACDVLPAAAQSGASRLFVGRDCEWRQLQDSFATAFSGTRQVVFLAGEAGIGKTAIIDEFVAHLAAQCALICMRGQCIEHYGMGEAYLPILEALGRLGRDEALPLCDLLRRYAPSWLAHLPALEPEQQRGSAAPSPVTATRMLRELSEALEHLASRQPVVLVLEDLHWSDTATLDWLAHFARRRDPARSCKPGCSCSDQAPEALKRSRSLFTSPMRGWWEMASRQSSGPVCDQSQPGSAYTAAASLKGRARAIASAQRMEPQQRRNSALASSWGRPLSHSSLLTQDVHGPGAG
jgi:DNA-binding winged helix-turn-helix (wHTH) protein